MAELFRKNALKQLTSINAIETHFQVLNPAAWIWIMIFSAFLLAFGSWTLYGSVSTTVPGTGIIFSTDELLENEKSMQIEIQRRRAKLASLQQLLHQKQILFNQKNLTINDMEKAEEDFQHAEDNLKNFINKGYINTRMSVFADDTKHRSKNLTALVFVNQAYGKLIHPGMSALLIPNGQSIYKHGYIKGKVISISRYAITKDALTAYLGNNNLADEYFSLGAPFMVKITLTHTTNTPSQLAWTTGKGPDFPLETGTTVTTKIITNTMPPFQLVFKNMPKLT